jgi:hypothetical protein
MASAWAVSAIPTQRPSKSPNDYREAAAAIESPAFRHVFWLAGLMALGESIGLPAMRSSPNPNVAPY